MRSIENLYTKALLESLCTAPLLVEDLPEAPAWGEKLTFEGEVPALNFDQKLGHLYEDAFAALMGRSDRYEMLARNLQVSDAAGRTVGELDFLLRDASSGEVWHVELAVKFYLAILDSDGETRFPGPDPSDNWINKLERMRERQLRLCERPETRTLLRDRFGVRDVKTAQRVYGIIFDPAGSPLVSRPPSVGSRCRRAKWLHVQQWETFFARVESARVVPKCLWPVLLSDGLLEVLEEVSVGELKRRARERCVLFWDERRGEVAFLVPDAWPDGI